jgi:ergothioneine biosynthesis protein EgtB
MPSTLPQAFPGSIDAPTMRHARRDLLSLALMDARNHTLHLLAQFEAAAVRLPVPPAAGSDQDPLWLAGHIGWFAEAWIGRNTQRSQGTACPSRPTRLASIDSRADAWWGDAGESRAEHPDAAATRAYLLETLESTLELLEKSPDDDATLYFYRLALFHEDLAGEQLMVLAQLHGVPLILAPAESLQVRPPLLMPAVQWQLGSEPGGFVFDNEKWAHEVAVPEFEIDAQPVTWAQFVEFVDDGGYDRPEFWQPEGWEWLQVLARLEGRRGPRFVEQIGVASGAVMQTRFGRAVRMAGNQAAMHLSWWEADAWCRWAGRRLPTEVEWEYAAATAGRRGFHWGAAHEWTAGTFRPWPGFTPDPWSEYSTPSFGNARAMRGASFATRARLRYVRYRGFALPTQDELFVGFRSCAY